MYRQDRHFPTVGSAAFAVNPNPAHTSSLTSSSPMGLSVLVLRPHCLNCRALQEALCPGSYVPRGHPAPSLRSDPLALHASDSLVNFQGSCLLFGGNVLNSLTRSDIFTIILGPPIHEFDVSLNLSGSSLISLKNVLCFLCGCVITENLMFFHPVAEGRHFPLYGFD